MKIVGVIPARYASTRFPGKPLVDICGKPMIWWVYCQVKKVHELTDIFVATDDESIASVCKQYAIPVVMTSLNCKTSTERVYEVALTVDADVYVCINGDEPLIEPEVIAAIIPHSLDNFYASNLMTNVTNPVEVVDNTNIKVVTDKYEHALFMSRSPIPYPKAGMNFEYRKHLGVLAYTKEALRFFINTPKGKNENIEDINELRFIENNKSLCMVEVNTGSLSVDTPKDLEYVRCIIAERIAKGEIVL
jgi:3-deoxy-manno-octulosonate cytidylyltransferase (CMP-KDO synthetase)